jgi:hypothetical protein
MTWWPEGVASARQVMVESQSGWIQLFLLDHWEEAIGAQG